jgi:hypothetical protein
MATASPDWPRYDKWAFAFEIAGKHAQLVAQWLRNFSTLDIE